MSILKSNGIGLVSSIPVHTPVDDQATLYRLVNTMTFYYWNSSTWLTIKLGDDTAYNASSWDSNLDVPTKNAIRDKIETIVSGLWADGDKGDITVSGGGTVFTVDSGLDPAKLANGSVSATEFQYLDGVTSAIQTQINTKAEDSAVVHNTGNENVAGIKTFSSNPLIPADTYGAGWDGSNAPPTKNDVYDKVQTLAIDSAVVHNTGDESIAGIKTFTSDPVVPDEVYGVGWNGSLEPPTKNAVYDEMETRAVDSEVVHNTGAENVGGVKTFTSAPIVPSEGFGAGWDGSLQVPTKKDLYDKFNSFTNGVQRYKAIWLQEGADAPGIVIEKENDFGNFLIFRDSVGVYVARLSNAFLTQDNFIPLTLLAMESGATFFFDMVWVDSERIQIRVLNETGSPADVLGRFSVVFEYWP